MKKIECGDFVQITSGLYIGEIGSVQSIQNQSITVLVEELNQNVQMTMEDAERIF